MLTNDKANMRRNKKNWYWSKSEVPYLVYNYNHNFYLHKIILRVFVIDSHFTPVRQPRQVPFLYLRKLSQGVYPES